MSEWIPLRLGDFQIGEIVRIKRGAPFATKFLEQYGTLEGRSTGARNGLVYMRAGADDSIGVLPEFLELKI